eukprot:PhM_4_TR5796/c0_g1_i2/m.107088
MLRRSLISRRGIPYVGNANSFTQTIDNYNWQSRKNMIGIPRKDRHAMGRILPIHDSKKLAIYHRKHCNNFHSVQYLVVEKQTNRGMLVDMSDDYMDDWIAFMSNAKIELQMVFITHMHLDNLIGGIPLYQMRKARGLETYFAYNPSDTQWLGKLNATCDRYRRKDVLEGGRFPLPRASDIRRGLVDGKSDIWLSAGSSRTESFFFLGTDHQMPCQYIHTPGHSLGHTILYLPEERMMFSGDLLFYESIGRVDLPWACGDQLAHSLRMLESFPDEVVVLPGHGRPTTLGHERKNNAGLLRVYEMMGAGMRVPRVGTNEGGYF